MEQNRITDRIIHSLYTTYYGFAPRPGTLSAIKICPVYAPNRAAIQGFSAASTLSEEYENLAGFSSDRAAADVKKFYRLIRSFICKFLINSYSCKIVYNKFLHTDLRGTRCTRQWKYFTSTGTATRAESVFRRSG